jgi:hypothetical protein
MRRDEDEESASVEEDGRLEKQARARDETRRREKRDGTDNEHDREGNRAGRNRNRIFNASF